MTKRTTGPGFPKLKPKKYPSPHKDVPVLGKEQRVPVRPRRSKKGQKRYRRAGLGTFMNAEKILRDVENKPKRGGGGYPLNPKLGGRDIGGKKPPWRKRKILE